MQFRKTINTFHRFRLSATAEVICDRAAKTRQLAVYEKVVSDPNGTYLSVIGWLFAIS